MRMTSANDEQKRSVEEMVKTMMSPKSAPDGNSFTLGWDVVVSYSEEQINGLLARRHANSPAKMLRNMEISFESMDPRSGDMYTAYYKLQFGPPKLQFNARSTTGASCSLTMPILAGTVQYGDDSPARKVDPGLSLRVSGIPLGSARGRIAEGTVQMSKKDEIQPSNRTVNFDYDSNEQAHVVLNFPLAKEFMVITCISESSAPPSAKQKFTTTAFQDGFKTFFIDNVDSLGYSIACVNNDSPKSGSNALEPSNFQFATFVKGKSWDAPDRTASDPDPITSLSMFIQTKSSASTGQREGLQSIWQAQWIKNEATPIPYGFTASLILSANLVYNAMLKPGFKKTGWTTDPVTDSNPGISLTAKSNKTFYAGSSNYPYSSKSNLWMGSLNIPLENFPMTFRLKQENEKSSPAVFIKWEMFGDCDWSDEGKFLNIGFLDTTWGSGRIRLHYKLNDQRTADKLQKVPSTIVLDDKEFKIDIDLQKASWETSHEKTPGTDKWTDALDIENADTMKSGIDRLKGLKPEATIESVGLNFLRTTNLLTPDREVIDFNEEIGLKVPRDFLLVGDVLTE